MRYVSEQFKEKQNQLIRPPLKMYFEVCSDVYHRVALSQLQQAEMFDQTVAPVILPRDCSNTYYYAVVGDGIGVDDPNRMCAPDNSGGTLSTPEHYVPIGVSTVISANSEALLGSNNLYNNFMGMSSPITFNFKGELIPERMRVERYVQSSSTWVEEAVIDNPDLSDEMVYTPDIPYMSGYRRFYFLNTTKSGRYQVNWLRRELAAQKNLAPVVFENDYISSAMIDEATDLTSQAEPNYGMTVTCLDVNGEYSPESSYWDKEFSSGQPCYLSVGYKNNEGIVERISLIEGYLTQKPTYDQGKITFKVSAWTLNTAGFTSVDSLPDSSLNSGDEVINRKISSIFTSTSAYFTNVDIFHDTADDDNSITNYYGEETIGNLRKMIANALGGYITAAPNTINLYSTCDIQYKAPVDYLTRYEQVKNSLDSQPKVRIISVAKKHNILSSDYKDIEAAERVSISAGGGSTTRYYLPFFAFGKAAVVDYQPSVSGANLRMGQITQSVDSSGNIRVNILIMSNVAITVKPIVRFYRVDTDTYEETETTTTTMNLSQTLTRLTKRSV